MLEFPYRPELPEVFVETFKEIHRRAPNGAQHSLRDQLYPLGISHLKLDTIDSVAESHESL